jgi:hypothetical protein
MGFKGLNGQGGVNRFSRANPQLTGVERKLQEMNRPAMTPAERSQLVKNQN